MYYYKIYVRTMSALCLHNVRTMSAQHLPRETYIFREMLCGHSAYIVGTYISRDICPHNVCAMSALYPSSVFSSGDLQTYFLLLCVKIRSGRDGSSIKKQMSRGRAARKSSFPAIRGVIRVSREQQQLPNACNQSGSSRCCSSD